VLNCDVDYGIIELENSLQGTINSTYESLLLPKYNKLQIFGEHISQDDFFIAALPNSRKSDIKEIFSTFKLAILLLLHIEKNFLTILICDYYLIKYPSNV